MLNTINFFDKQIIRKGNLLEIEDIERINKEYLERKQKQKLESDIKKMYKSNNPLFRDLNDKEETQFREYTSKFCLDGFNINDLGIIHPIIRTELIRLLKSSLER